MPVTGERERRQRGLLPPSLNLTHPVEPPSCATACVPHAAAQPHERSGKRGTAAGGVGAWTSAHPGRVALTGASTIPCEAGGIGWGRQGERERCLLPPRVMKRTTGQPRWRNARMRWGFSCALPAPGGAVPVSLSLCLSISDVDSLLTFYLVLSSYVSICDTLTHSA